MTARHQERAGDRGPPRGRFVLVGGGARSGKSAFALARAKELGAQRLFLATAQAYDDEMAARIAAHRAERGPDFETIEAPLDLPEALEAITQHPTSIDVVVIDCLTLWLSNLLLGDVDEAAILARLEVLLAQLERSPAHVVLVTNEVGMSLVPETPLGRAFRDLTGRAHQRCAARADEIYLAALGTVLRLRPDPVTLVAPPFAARTAGASR